jgi:hypothetical protein
MKHAIILFDISVLCQTGQLPPIATGTLVVFAITVFQHLLYSLPVSEDAIGGGCANNTENRSNGDCSRGDQHFLNER